MTAPTAKWMTLGFAIMKRLSSVISAAAPNAMTRTKLSPCIRSMGFLRHFEQRELADADRERAGDREDEVAGREEEHEEDDRAEEIFAELTEGGAHVSVPHRAARRARDDAERG